MSFQNAKVESVGSFPSGYHQQAVARGTKEFAVSPSSLREFAKCPRRWMDGYESPGSDAKHFGSILDCRLLTPQEFNDRFVVQPETYAATTRQCPKCHSVSDAETCRKCNTKRETVLVQKPWNGNAEACAKWLEQQGGREVTHAGTVANCDAAEKALMADEVIAAFFKDSDKQVLVTGEWHDEKSGLVIPVRCLMDFVPKVDSEFGKCLGDLKTTRNAGLTAWSRWCFQAGYHIQAGFDTDIYVAATGEDRNTWCFIVQENYAPWQTGKRMLAQDHGLDFGRMEYQRMLAFYCACLKSGRWPGYDDHEEAVQGWSVVSAEPWMESRMLFEPRLQTETPEAEPEAQPEEMGEVTP